MAKPPVKRNAGRRPTQNNSQKIRRSPTSGSSQRRIYDQQASRPESQPKFRTVQNTQRTVRRPPADSQRRSYPQQPPRRERGAPPPRRPAQPSRQRYNAPRRLTHSELRRRRRRRNLLMALLGLLVVGVGVALSLTVLFKVDTFRIENMDGSVPANTGIYTEDAILGALGVPVGENMFQFSASDKEKSMMISLPYLERVEVRRRLPSTLVIRVEPAVETWCAQSDSGWLTLSDGLKIMAIGEEQPQGLPALLGLDIDAPVAGYSLQLKKPTATASPAPAASGASSTSTTSSSSGASSQTENQQSSHDPMDELTKLLELLWTYNLKEDCTSIQFGQENELYFVYQNRAKVLLGTFNNLDYKIKFAAYLLHNEDGKGIADNEQGTLDVSHQLEDGSLRPTWSPGSIEETAPQTDAASGDNAAAGEPAATGEGDTSGGDATAGDSTETGDPAATGDGTETGNQVGDGAETGDQAGTDAEPAATPAPTEPPAA